MNPKKQTPLKAIRRKCVDDCCVGSRLEVRLCPKADCALHPFRMGRKPKATGLDGEGTVQCPSTTLAAIRERCMNCSAWEAAEVRNCTFTHCELYPYRMGHNPRRKGIGNPEALRRYAAQKAQAERHFSDEQPETGPEATQEPPGREHGRESVIPGGKRKPEGTRPRALIHCEDGSVREVESTLT